jgi:hypothetical protein
MERVADTKAEAAVEAELGEEVAVDVAAVIDTLGCTLLHSGEHYQPRIKRK